MPNATAKGPEFDEATDLGWSKRLFVALTISIGGLLSVGVLGGYTIYSQARRTQEALRVSQARADAASRAEAAILVMGQAELRLVSASDQEEQRAAAVLAIQASSTLDESTQRLEKLVDSPKVGELSHLLAEINPAKLAIIRAVRENRHAAAKAALRNMTPAMTRIQDLSGDLVSEESTQLLAAMATQEKQAKSTLWVLAMLVGCSILLSLLVGWELRTRTLELARARRESEIFISCVPSILIGADQHGRVTRWNTAATRVFGIDATEVLGKPLSDCGIKWNSDLGPDASLWNEGAESRRRDDITFERAGETRFLGLTVNPIRYVAAGPLELLITGADITDRQRLENDLRQAQKLEAIGQLAAGVAHEINTPVQYARDNVTFLEESWCSIEALLRGAQTLSDELGQGNPQAAHFQARCQEAGIEFLQAEVPGAISQSLEGLERIAKIVRAMKEFSHPGAREKKPLDINRAIESTVTVAQNEWKYVAHVSTDFDEQLPHVPCYAGEFNQVILNLVINASHAVADAIKGKPDTKGTISLSTRRDSDWVEIRVGDTGGGIPAEIGNKVFDPFFTTKEVGKGTGQGLALAYSVIVKQHGGKIWFESTVGRGTTFFLRLPISAAPQA